MTKQNKTMNSQETINTIKQMLNDGYITQEIAEKYCPELKEDEGEKIRKEIIAYISAADDKELIPWESWINWLEQIGEHKNFIKKIQVGDNVTRNKDGELVNLSQLNRVAKVDEKVEPKYKVGDHIILTTGELETTLQIIRIDGRGKRYWFDDGSYLPFNEDQCLRLWTIQEASEGDIISGFVVNGIPWVGIFKAMINKDLFSVYCFKYAGSDEFLAYDEAEHCAEGTQPATSTEKNLLFQAMAKAGYIWNGEKLKLEKIEK